MGDKFLFTDDELGPINTLDRAVGFLNKRIADQLEHMATHLSTKVEGEVDFLNYQIHLVLKSRDYNQNYQATVTVKRDDKIKPMTCTPAGCWD